MSQTKTRRARARASQIAENMNRYAAALYRFAAAVESSEDRATLAAFMDSDGQPSFQVSGLRHALRSIESAEQLRREQIEATAQKIEATA